MGQVRRLWRGDSGMVPIVLGLAILVIYFQARNSVFLSAGNVTNLFVQATVFILLGMAEIWLLLLGDIDLSVGYTMGVGAAITVILVDHQFHWPWYAAFAVTILATTGIATLQGLIVIFFRLPSFIVTLAGLLFWEGMLINLVDHQGIGGSISNENKILYNLVNGNFTTVFTWIFMVVVVLFMAQSMVRADQRRRASGLVTRARMVLAFKIGVLAVTGIALALLFNANRGTFIVLQGMPYAIPIDFAVLAAGSVILTKTKAGRYIYAIGGNSEAARRSGINVNRYRLLAFALTGLTTGIASLLYASRLGGISDNIDSSLVLYAVASAVIGGTSLFGGRGKMIHAVIGGIVIATIYNGMALISIGPATQYMAIALVLLAAVTIDSIARRGSTTN
ncbi:MAG: sugar ABC transporter permease [Acidimicrobiales bacterium]